MEKTSFESSDKLLGRDSKKVAALSNAHAGNEIHVLVFLIENVRSPFLS